MDQSQASDETSKKGCGCGGNSKVASFIDIKHSQLSEQQEKLISRIQKTVQRKNSIYKTNTRYFM